MLRGAEHVLGLRDEWLSVVSTPRSRLTEIISCIAA